MRRPDLLILVAVWEFLTAAGALIGISAISIFAFPEILKSQGISRIGGIVGLSIVLLLLIAYVSIAIAGGMGLVNGKEWGRVLSIAHAAVSLFWIPFGTVIGTLTIIYLVRPEIKEFFKSIEKPAG